MIYRFGEFELDVSAFELRLKGELIALEPLVFALLQLLVENRDRMVTKEEILTALWGARSISNSVVNTTVSSVRKALGDSAAEQAFVRTFPRRGYRFVAPVEIIENKDGNTGSVASWYSKPSIAVLPFDDLTGDATQAHLATAFTEGATIGLSRLGWASISAHPMPLTSQDFLPLAQSGDRVELSHSGYVVRGSVQKSDDCIRMAIRLLDFATDRVIWAEQFDRSAKNILDAQDEIIQLAVSEIAQEITGAEIRTSLKKSPDNLTAWDRYMQGLSHFHERTSEKYVSAQALFEEAIEIDPNLAEAYVALSKLHASRLGCFVVEEDGEEHRDTCLRLARKAVELDGRYAPARLALGICHTHRQEYDDAHEQLLEAIKLNPADALAHRWFGAATMYSGAAADALDSLERAVELSERDPTRGPNMMHLGFCHLFLENFGEAISWARKALGEPTSTQLTDALFLSCCGHMGIAASADPRVAAVKARLPRTDGVSKILSPLVRNSAYGSMVIEGLRKVAISQVRVPKMGANVALGN